MNFMEELRWRNMLHDITPGAEDYLKTNNPAGYIGFDPTAKSLTIGNFVQIMLLKFWQLSGNQPIVLMGGATGRVGDPSGKNKERTLQSEEELDFNLNNQIKQITKFLDFEGPNKALIVNNHDFYKNLNVLSFLRNVGKTLTVNYMMSKDSVKNRLQTGLSFTEFSYQLLQAYDFQCLFERHNCLFQMGGSDQWGNITSGTEFIRRNIQGKAFAVTTPLLTKADGTKFGKSTQGNIWLDAEMTSPYKFYQFWLNSDDADIIKFLKYFSLKSRDELSILILEHSNDPNYLKKELAKELTQRVHSIKDLESVETVTKMLFDKKVNAETVNQLKLDQLETISQEIPCSSLAYSTINTSPNIIDLIAEHANIVDTKSDARRAIKNNAIAINKEKIQDMNYTIDKTHLLHDQYLLIDNGKKNKYILRFNKS